MSMKKRGLGKNNLDLLLGSALSTMQEFSSDEAETTTTEHLKQLPISTIQPGQFQPRRMFKQEQLEELAASIRAQGIIQPLIVRTIAPQKYELIAGERRWRAAQLAGLQTVPVVVKDLPDQTVLAMALIENIQREDLNPIEEANAIHRLAEEFDLTHQAVADTIGRSRAAVTNLLRLLNLPEDVKRLLETGQLEMGHARALLTLDTSQQRSFAQKIIAEQLSVRETEQLIRDAQSASSEPATTKHVDPDILRLERELSERLGASVQVHHQPKTGNGKVVIKYSNIDILEGILEHIK